MKKGNILGVSKVIVRKIVKKLFAALFGLLAGAANALFGGGGGMLVVPAMEGLLDVTEREAHASAIAVMLPISVLSAILLSIRGAMDVGLALTVGGGAVVGGACGALLLNKVPKGVLSLLFYGVMIYAGVRYLG